MNVDLPRIITRRPGAARRGRGGAGIRWFPILLSTDLAKSREFYHDTLGLEILWQDEERIIFRCGSGSQLSVTCS